MAAIDQSERREMVREFHESGMTQKDFAVLHGVTRSTLGYWVRRLRKEAEPDRTAMMVPVGSIPSSPRREGMKITTRSGVVVEIELPASEETIQTILKAAAAI